MSEGPGSPAVGDRMEKQGRGVWGEWTREYRVEVMDPVEGEEMGGAVPSLGDKGQEG